jgi:hypothetical protein
MLFDVFQRKVMLRISVLKVSSKNTRGGLVESRARAPFKVNLKLSAVSLYNTRHIPGQRFPLPGRIEYKLEGTET